MERLTPLLGLCIGAAIVTAALALVAALQCHRMLGRLRDDLNLLTMRHDNLIEYHDILYAQVKRLEETNKVLRQIK
jgi:hypothetical protein